MNETFQNFFSFSKMLVVQQMLPKTDNKNIIFKKP